MGEGGGKLGVFEAVDLVAGLRREQFVTEARQVLSSRKRDKCFRTHAAHIGTKMGGKFNHDNISGFTTYQGKVGQSFGKHNAIKIRNFVALLQIAERERDN